MCVHLSLPSFKHAGSRGLFLEEDGVVAAKRDKDRGIKKNLQLLSVGRKVAIFSVEQDQVEQCESYIEQLWYLKLVLV